MQGDFTRNTFDPKKHYRDILQQQGRVQVDADWNEQAELTARRDETTTADIVGDCGGPADNAAFGIVSKKSSPGGGPELGGGTGGTTKLGLPIGPRESRSAGDFLLTAGRYYVDGIQCENEHAVAYTTQPDRLDVPKLGTNKSFLIYLDVWLRHITALEDRSIREPALGGSDTATRVKTVWQARALELEKAIDKDNPCGSGADAFQRLRDPGTARLVADTAKVPAPKDPCLVPASAGFTGLENELYRVEIQDPSTWKWSRENASVITRIEKIAGDKITVSSLGPDKNLGFTKDAWVEILDDALELEGNPGQLAQIDDVDEATRIITLKSGISGLLPSGFSTTAYPNGIVPERHPKLRRWEGIAPLQFGIWLPLESGVQVKFAANGDYRTGHYWQIPARTATAQSPAGDIEWPFDNAGNRAALPAFGIKHHYCRLGIVVVHADGSIDTTDCRCLWPALTRVPRLFYVSGDGQEVMPVVKGDNDGSDAEKHFQLPRPLIVGVANAQCLKQPAVVHFYVSAGTGTVAAQGDSPTKNFAKIPTDANGLAVCEFYLDGKDYSQQVTARLLDANGQPVSLPLIFNANLSVANQVAYDPAECPDLKKAGVNTVQGAIDALCKESHQKSCCVSVGKDGDFSDLEGALRNLLQKDLAEICICLMPGDHPVSDGLLIVGGDSNPLRHLHIHGCGRGSRILLKKRLLSFGLTSFTLQDLCIYADDPPDEEVHAIAIQAPYVTIERCHLRQRGARNDWVSIAATEGGRVHIADNVIEASIEIEPRILDDDDDSAPSLKAAPDPLKAVALAATTNLAGKTKKERTAFLKEFRKIAKDVPPDLPEKQAFAKTLKHLSAAARAKSKPGAVIPEAAAMPSVATPEELAASLKDAIAGILRLVQIPTPALVIAYAKADTAIINNFISGELRIYGTTAADTAADFLTKARLMQATNVVVTSANTLRIEGNVLRDIVVDKSVADNIHPGTPTTPPSVTGLFTRMSVLDNSFSALGHQWLAGHVISSGNHFNQGITTAPVLAATAAGSSFICLGTSCNRAAQIRRGVPLVNFRESGNLVTFVQ